MTYIVNTKPFSYISNTHHSKLCTGQFSDTHCHSPSSQLQLHVNVVKHYKVNVKYFSNLLQASKTKMPNKISYNYTKYLAQLQYGTVRLFRFAILHFLTRPTPWCNHKIQQIHCNNLQNHLPARKKKTQNRIFHMDDIMLKNSGIHLPKSYLPQSIAPK